MPAFATVTINDGAATPVARNFAPTVIADGVATLEDRSGGIAIGFPVITTSLRRPKGGSTNYRAVAKIRFPVLEQTSASTATGIQPAPTVAYVLQGEVSFILPQRATLQDRKHVLALTKNLMAHATSTSLIESLEGQY